MDTQADAPGKKIFFLYPPSVVRDEMLDVLIMAGYEAYTLVDEKKAVMLLTKFPYSIMFINIDAGLTEKEWEAYIKAIHESPQTNGARLGILSYNQNTALMKKYLMEMDVPCGYIQLKLGLHESTKIILSALEANEARGRRNNIRASCEDDKSAAVNYKGDTGLFHGKILEISAAGIIAKFNNLPEYPAKTLLRSVQLKLRSGIVMADMVLAGQRPDDKKVQILVFDQKLSKESKLVIHQYIKQCLQKYIDGLKI